MPSDDAVTLALLVRKMREAQRGYFKSRSPGALTLSKRLEAQVDEEVKRLLEGPPLFPLEVPDGE